MFLSCAFINFIFVFLTSGQDCNSGMQKPIHFRTDKEHYICRPVNHSDVSLGYQFCENITFILYIIYNVRYNNIQLLPALKVNIIIVHPRGVVFPKALYHGFPSLMVKHRSVGWFNRLTLKTMVSDL